jgi:predicted DNA-binding protein (UPF0251 family)
MGRRKICRRVAGSPASTMYKPTGEPLRNLTWAVLPVEGLEALRLVDAEGLGQEQAADRMGVSRPTLNRILGQARSVVARALANGWALRIEGGDWVLAGEAPQPDTEGEGAAPCGRGRGRGRCGHGRRNGPGGG